MALLDVNVLVALAWDSHVHHEAARVWFSADPQRTWATCSITESGFVRVSSNPKVLPAPISVADARLVLAGIRAVAGHRFLTDDVSLTDPDVPAMLGHRQIADGHLLTLARRNAVPLVTFDQGIASLAGAAGGVELLGGA